MAEPDQAHSETGRLKVFISYSRKDVDFADDLELFLDTRGFDPILDRHDIDHNDDWQERLSELILACDVVVFVLTEVSAASPICAWEVAEAAKLGKRRLVVTPGALPAGTKPPEGLGAANWIHCWRNPAVPNSSIANGKKELERALRTNLKWVRTRTWLQERSTEWRNSNLGTESISDSTAMLLRGSVLQESLLWTGRAPQGEEIPHHIFDFLAASEAHEARLQAEAEAGLAERELALSRAADASRKVRRASMVGAAVAAVFLVTALAAGWIALQMQAEAQRQQTIAANRNADILAREAQIMANQRMDPAALLMAIHAARNLPDGPPESTDSSERESFVQAMLQSIFFELSLTNEAVVTLVDRVAEEGSPAVAIAPDGSQIAVAESGGNVGLYDTQTGVQRKVLQGPATDIAGLAFSSDGSRLAVSSEWSDYAVRIWDLQSGELLSTLNAHTTYLTYVRFNDAGTYVATSAGDGTTRLWDAETGKPVAILPEPSQDATFVPDSALLALRTAAGVLRLWDTKSGDVWPADPTNETGDSNERLLALELGKHSLSQAIYENNRGELSVGRILRATVNGKPAIAAFGAIAIQGVPANATFVAASPDFDLVATALPDGTVQVQKTRTEYQQEPQRLSPSDRPLAARFFDDSTRLATVSSSGDALRRVENRGISTPQDEHQAFQLKIQSWAIDAEKSIRMRRNRRAMKAPNYVSDNLSYWFTPLANGAVAVGDTHAEANAVPHVITSKTEAKDYGVELPDIFFVGVAEQIRMACEKLSTARAALAFSKAEVSAYPVLRGEPEDPENSSMLMSPCRGVLPENAFAKTMAK